MKLEFSAYHAGTLSMVFQWLKRALRDSTNFRSTHLAPEAHPKLW